MKFVRRPLQKPTLRQICETNERRYLAPHQHGAEHDLQSVEEVVADDDDGGAACGPAFTWADGLYARGSCL